MKSKNNESPVNESLTTKSNASSRSPQKTRFHSPFLEKLRKRMNSEALNNAVKKLDFDKHDHDVL